MKRAQLRKKFGANVKRTKALPKGNLHATGNEGGRRARERRPINARVPMSNGMGGLGYALPVASGTSVTAAKQHRGERPGTGRPGIRWHLPPEGPPIKLR
jgi:hypothetical protein